MAVFLPLRASCLVSRWQISANRTLSVMRAFKTSDEDLRYLISLHLLMFTKTDIKFRSLFFLITCIFTYLYSEILRLESHFAVLMVGKALLVIFVVSQHK